MKLFLFFNSSIFTRLRSDSGLLPGGFLSSSLSNLFLLRLDVAGLDFNLGNIPTTKYNTFLSVELHLLLTSIATTGQSLADQFTILDRLKIRLLDHAVTLLRGAALSCEDATLQRLISRGVGGGERRAMTGLPWLTQLSSSPQSSSLAAFFTF